VLFFSFLSTYLISGRRCRCPSGTPDSIRSQEGKPRYQLASPEPAASPPLCPMLSGLPCPQSPCFADSLTVLVIWITGKQQNTIWNSAGCPVLGAIETRSSSSPAASEFKSPYLALYRARPCQPSGLPLHLPAWHCSLRADDVAGPKSGEAKAEHKKGLDFFLGFISGSFFFGFHVVG